ncbi:MAG: hypothetical protein ACFCU5_04385 [Pleurocapsa sp.]
MAESKYIFTDTQFTSELERLQLIEKISDPASRQIMLATGLTPILLLNHIKLLTFVLIR